jgi:hypothetical protein
MLGDDDNYEITNSMLELQSMRMSVVEGFFGCIDDVLREVKSSNERKESVTGKPLVASYISRVWNFG